VEIAVIGACVVTGEDTGDDTGEEVLLTLSRVVTGEEVTFGEETSLGFSVFGMYGFPVSCCLLGGFEFPLGLAAEEIQDIQLCIS